MKKSYHGLMLLLVIAFSSLSVGASLTITNKIRVNATLENEPLETKTVTQITIDAWIIISGSREDYDKQEIIDNGCNLTYEILSSIGFSSDHIYYLGPPAAAPGPTSLYQNDTATLAHIQYAIETWAAGRVSASEALGIYMFNHGGVDSMCLVGPNLADTDLNTYLDNFEASTGCNRMLIVYEGCESGSFINPVSKSNRIVVTATDATHNSNVNGDWTWAAFSETFWASLKNCQTIAQAFEDAEANVHALGYGGGQFPWIDDDHDETGHEVDAAGNLPNGGDGNDAQNKRITPWFGCLKPIRIIYWPIRLWIPQSMTTMPIWVKIENASLVEKVYARVMDPNWRAPTLGKDDGDGIPLAIDTLSKIVELHDFDGDGNYSGIIMGMFTGDWKINFLGRTTDGGFADIESSIVTVNTNGLPPADTTNPTVVITNPTSSSSVSGTLNITAEGDDDQALDKLQLYIDGALAREEIMPSYYPYDISYEWDAVASGTGDHNITAIAIDKANNTATTSIIVNVPAGIPGFEFTVVIIGSFLVVIITYALRPKKEL